MAEETNIVERIRARSAELGSARVLTSVLDPAAEPRVMTFAELDRRARAVAGLLQTTCRAGDRAVLLFPHGLDYVATLIGCFYAGVVAVPAYPPNAAKLASTSARVGGILADADASIILTDTTTLAFARSALAEPPAGWLATDRLADGAESEWRPTLIHGDSLAMLQYTSGSTSSPKGVMLSHRNLVENLAMIHRTYAIDETTRVLSWLPLYHDMGLIGCVLGPAVWGVPSILLPPLRTLARPIRWLQAISRFRANTCAAPNFGYDLAVRRTSDEECAGLDLSCWTRALNAAEPVRADTLDAFTRKFAPYGFDRRAFRPTYGLAEATVFVSAGAARVEPTVVRVQTGPLADGVVVPASSDDLATRTFVAVGCEAANAQVSIVDPVSLSPVDHRRVGEIWVKGPHVAHGYWNRAEESAAAFTACLDGSGEGPFLRTGDLGFLEGGELFVIGRMRDLLVIHGKNHAAEDIEDTVRRRSPAVRVGAVAAFSIDSSSGESAVVIAEVEALRHAVSSRGTSRATDPSRAIDVQAVARELRRAVFEESGVNLHAVVFVRSGSMARTSSGKVQRHACKRAYLEGSLATLDLSQSAPSAPVE
jgi:acyl-CoA synthetase (AMP-forming)/AMP-acid ligase II